jgi:glycine cleavage system H protein
VEAVKTVSDLYAPVSGTVTEVNSALNDNPAVVNSDPYGDGWIVKMTIDGETSGELLDVDQYRALIGH